MTVSVWAFDTECGHMEFVLMYASTLIEYRTEHYIFIEIAGGYLHLASGSEHVTFSDSVEVTRWTITLCCSGSVNPR